jgi:hypothetical protein
MAIDKSLYLLDKDLHFSSKLKIVLGELARARSISATYSEECSDFSLALPAFSIPGSKRGLLEIFIVPEDTTEKPNVILIKLTSDDEANQKSFDGAAKQLESMYGIKHPVYTIMKDEDTLFKQLITELKN